MSPALAIGLLMTLVTALVVGRRALHALAAGPRRPAAPAGQPARPAGAGRGRDRRGARPAQAAEVDGARGRALLRLLGLHHPGPHHPRGLPRDHRPRVCRSRSSTSGRGSPSSRTSSPWPSSLRWSCSPRSGSSRTPTASDALSRFYGSHTGAAWLVLFMIFNVVWTLLFYRGAKINSDHFPYPDDLAFASQFFATIARATRRDDERTPRDDRRPGAPRA